MFQGTFRLGAFILAAAIISSLSYSFGSKGGTAAAVTSTPQKPANAALAQNDPAQPKRCTPVPIKVELTSGVNGHYHSTVNVNDTPVQMVVDTGASFVSLTEADARKAGIDIRGNRNRVTMATANGLAQATRVRLNSISIGRLVVCDVDAIVMPGPGISLLGMTFLQKLKGFEVASGNLVLKP